MLYSAVTFATTSCATAIPKKRAYNRDRVSGRTSVLVIECMDDTSDDGHETDLTATQWDCRSTHMDEKVTVRRDQCHEVHTGAVSDCEGAHETVLQRHESALCRHGVVCRHGFDGRDERERVS